MPQGCTRCVVFSRFWAVRWLRQSLLPSGAGRRNLRLWEKAWGRLELSSRVEDWSTAAAPGWVRRIRAAGTKGDIGQMSVTKLVTYSRGWCWAQNEMPVVMRYEGGQSARSEQHRWVKKKVDFNLMPQDVEDTWGRVEQLKMSVSVRSTPR